jgi:hypothetical protein
MACTNQEWVILVLPSNLIWPPTHTHTPLWNDLLGHVSNNSCAPLASINILVSKQLSWEFKVITQTVFLKVCKYSYLCWSTVEIHSNDVHSPKQLWLNHSWVTSTCPPTLDIHTRWCYLCYITVPCWIWRLFFLYCLWKSVSFAGGLYGWQNRVSSCPECGVKVKKIVQVMKPYGQVEIYIFFSWHNSP